MDIDRHPDSGGPAADRIAPLRIAHLSDLHILDLQGTSWRRFLNKRATGAANLVGMRRSAHPVALAEGLAAWLHAASVDHVLITGDLTNLSLQSEFARARRIIETIGGPDFVTLVPGNHDAYTHGSARTHRFERTFGDYLVAADASAEEIQRARDAGRAHYPFAKDITPQVRVYGLSSAVPTPPMLAFGYVGRDQLGRLERMVATETSAAAVRIVLVHHNIHHRHGPAEYTASLIDRRAFARSMRTIGASLVLHGHVHTPHQGHLASDAAWRPGNAGQPEPGASIPVLACGSSTWSSRSGYGDRAHINVIEVSPRGLERVRSYRYDAEACGFVAEHDDLLERALDHAIGL